MNLKGNLKRILYEKDMTAAQLARLSGVSKTTISEWLAGRNPRDLRKLKQVADKLDVSLDEICFGIKPLKPISLDELKEDIQFGRFDVILRPVKEK